MDELTSQIKDRYAKAAAKVDRAEKALDSARSELSDLEAALRVIESLAMSNGAPSARGSATDAMAERHANIVCILPEGAENGLEPKELHAHFSVIHGSDLSLDTFRTTVWRMKDKFFPAEDGGEWEVKNTDGRYWKLPAIPAEKLTVRQTPRENGRGWGQHTGRSGTPIFDDDEGEAPF